LTVEGIDKPFIQQEQTDSEIVFGLVGAVGTDLNKICDIIKNRLIKFFRYDVDIISVSSEILSSFLSSYLVENIDEKKLKSDEYYRIDKYMDLGTSLRQNTHNGVLAMAVANLISSKREQSDESARPLFRQGYIIKSLKNTEEVNILRDIYGNGFYLIGVYEGVDERISNLVTKRNIADDAAKRLVEKDEDEETGYGQQARDTFQLADFFIDSSSTNEKKTEANVFRILDLIFGNPFITPTFGEYAMFMAHCASLRSADLSRQIGAVVCKNDEILATGANDCPAFGGGLYWPVFNKETNEYEDFQDGRDYKRGKDTNKTEFLAIVKEVFEKFEIEYTVENLKKIKSTPLGDITEYGRVVHAEMEALATCSRNNVSLRNAELYVTTFPCHNCAKHIIASGIKKVVYIEPYPKSKTFMFYSESITQNENEENKKKKVLFMPFFGVGPRRFVELFAMNANFLSNKKRQKKDFEYLDNIDDYGQIIEWNREDANLRSQMMFTTYIDREMEYSEYYIKYLDDNGLIN
jgi:deoxycytidylate deaminase